MPFLQKTHCLLQFVFLDSNQVKSYHLRRSIYASWTMHIDIPSRTQYLLHNLYSLICILYEIRIVHVLNRTSFEFYPVLFAHPSEIVRRYPVSVVIWFALDWQNCIYLPLFQLGQILSCLWVWTHKYIGRYFWEFEGVEATLVHYPHFTPRMVYLLATREAGIGLVEIENSSRFPLGL